MNEPVGKGIKTATRQWWMGLSQEAYALLALLSMRHETVVRLGRTRLVPLERIEDVICYDGPTPLLGDLILCEGGDIVFFPLADARGYTPPSIQRELLVFLVAGPGMAIADRIASALGTRSFLSKLQKLEPLRAQTASSSVEELLLTRVGSQLHPRDYGSAVLEPTGRLRLKKDNGEAWSVLILSHSIEAVAAKLSRWEHYPLHLSRSERTSNNDSPERHSLPESVASILSVVPACVSRWGTSLVRWPEETKRQIETDRRLKRAFCLLPVPKVSMVLKNLAISEDTECSALAGALIACERRKRNTYVGVGVALAVLAFAACSLIPAVRSEEDISQLLLIMIAVTLLSGLWLIVSPFRRQKALRGAQNSNR